MQCKIVGLLERKYSVSVSQAGKCRTVFAADDVHCCRIIDADNMGRLLLEDPCAMGLPIWVSFIVLKPSIPPNRPTQTTTAAVSAGMPPIDFVTSMAVRGGNGFWSQRVNNLVKLPSVSLSGLRR